uniref:Uncharacterized protein n=1 Tax=Brugia malayi TaxID=6279 RepID=A8PXP6_BRUMA
MVKIGIPKEILQPEKLKAGRDIMSMTQEKNVTEQHKKPSALSQMITVKNICSLSTERHKREIYKAVYDEDGRPVLHKQPTCKNKELTTALEPISRQTEEFQEFMPVEAFEKKGEKDGINFDIVMQLEMEEGKRETGIVLAKETAAAARVIDYQWRETARKEVYYTQGIQIEWLLKDANSQFQEDEMDKPKMIVLQREK